MVFGTKRQKSTVRHGELSDYLTRMVVMMAKAMITMMMGRKRTTTRTGEDEKYASSRRIV